MHHLPQKTLGAWDTQGLMVADPRPPGQILEAALQMCLFICWFVYLYVFFVWFKSQRKTLIADHVSNEE